MNSRAREWAHAELERVLPSVRAWMKPECLPSDDDALELEVDDAVDDLQYGFQHLLLFRRCLGELYPLVKRVYERSLLCLGNGPELRQLFAEEASVSTAKASAARLELKAAEEARSGVSLFMRDVARLLGGAVARFEQARSRLGRGVQPAPETVADVPAVGHGLESLDVQLLAARVASNVEANRGMKRKKGEKGMEEFGLAEIVHAVLQQPLFDALKGAFPRLKTRAMLREAKYFNLALKVLQVMKILEKQRAAPDLPRPASPGSACLRKPRDEADLLRHSTNPVNPNLLPARVDDDRPVKSENLVHTTADVLDVVTLSSDDEEDSPAKLEPPRKKSPPPPPAKEVGPRVVGDEVRRRLPSGGGPKPRPQPGANFEDDDDEDDQPCTSNVEKSPARSKKPGQPRLPPSTGRNLPAAAGFEDSDAVIEFPSPRKKAADQTKRAGPLTSSSSSSSSHRAAGPSSAIPVQERCSFCATFRKFCRAPWHREVDCFFSPRGVSCPHCGKHGHDHAWCRSNPRPGRKPNKRN